MAFARELDAVGALPGPIGLVPCAFGGSPLLRWEKREDGDPLHDKWEGRAPVNTHTASIWTGRRCSSLGCVLTRVPQDIAGNGHEPEEVQRGDLYARRVRRARAALAAAKPGAVLAGALWCASSPSLSC